MGNKSSKSKNKRSISLPLKGHGPRTGDLDISSSIHANVSGHNTPLSERETSSAWYRYGVSVTDVYDVIEILGQGNMGEVFTVRRKVTGHHTNMTRNKLKESEDDLKLMLNKEEKVRRESGSAGKSKVVYPVKLVRKRSGSGMKERKNSFSDLKAVGKTIKSRITKHNNSNHVNPEEDSCLAPFIKSEEEEYASASANNATPRDVSSAGSANTNSTPLKSAIKNREESKFTSGDLNNDHLGSSSSVDNGGGADDYYGPPSNATQEEEAATQQPQGLNATNSNPKKHISRTKSTITTKPTSSTISANIGTTAKKEVKQKVHFQRTFAVKTILTSRINKDQLDELVNEIMIMRKLDHPFVLKLYEVYHVKRKLWLVTELLTGGDLSSRKLNEYDTKNVIEQVLRALVYLHRMNIVHRDLKLENVLYENHSKAATVRLIDFGLSRTFDRSIAADYSRTPYTMSPETATALGKGGGKSGKGGKSKSGGGDKKNGEIPATDKTDVWAVGICAFIMLSGEFPFIKTDSDLKDDDKMNKLKKAQVQFGITWKGRGITPNAKEFVKGCLKKDPKQRWTAKQALQYLQKSWAPDVDKAWNDWQAEIKKNKKPEFVPSTDELDGDDDDEENASETGSQSSSSILVENDDEVAPATFDQQARAKNIKRHVQKLVNKKKAEGPILTAQPSVKIDMEEVERYTKAGFMKKTILLTMANTMDRGDVPKLRELFLKSDTEDTGTITLNELIASFRRVSPEVDVKRVEELFDGIDRDKSGHIHYAEFLAALAESHGLVTLDRLTEAFDRIDTDGKGYISHDDLKNILGKDYDKETVDKMIEEGDFKKNNKIDYEELLQLMFSDPVVGDELAGDLPSPEGNRLSFEDVS